MEIYISAKPTLSTENFGLGIGSGIDFGCSGCKIPDPTDSDLFNHMERPYIADAKCGLRGYFLIFF